MLKHRTTLLLLKPLFTLALVASVVSAPVKADILALNSHTDSDRPDSTQSLSQPDTVSCPSSFHDVSITDDATQCQQFETQIPAAMVYHTKQKNHQVVAFYQQGMPSLKVHAPVNQRTLLTSENNHTRIVISPDNAGSQVDILVVPKK